MIIQELSIYTNQLEEQKQFYAETLGCTLLEQSHDFVRFQIGRSRLKFIKRKKHTPYHFAINIPSNKIEEALQWLKPRVSILKPEEKEIQDFKAWNAKAIYFYDVDQNIIEFIARKNLNNDSIEKFDQNSLLEISEMGIPTADIKKEYLLINDKLGLEIYHGSYKQFCAIGTETGLFICIDKNIKDWFPMNDKAYSSDFKLKGIAGEKPFEMEYINEKLKIIDGFDVNRA